MSHRWMGEAPATDLTEDDLGALGLDREFEDQATAERWLADHWAELADAGVTSVSLFRADLLVYGPMSLAER